MEQEPNYYFPWVRKGLSNRINEIDTLADGNKLKERDKDLARQRPVLSVTAKYKKTPAADLSDPAADNDETEQKEAVTFSETKDVQFISPGDITGVNSSAIMKVAPKDGSDGFPFTYYPYIEFWEPDFPWRYTPAHQTDDDKLRPWLALLVCKKDLCSIVRMDDGRHWVSLRVDDGEYGTIFPAPEDTWKSAHAQGESGGEPALSRLLALRQSKKMPENAEHYAFLVPAFETGRLRGLGYGDEVIKDVVAQLPAWEKSLAEQNAGHPKQPLDFPVYYAWGFKTGRESFDGMVRNLKITGDNNADIRIDVSHMGEGLDYDLFDPESENKAPEKTVIGMPAAVKTIGYDYLKTDPFPKKTGDEKIIHDRLKDLISKNPVFLENKIEISTGDAGNTVGDDDPWVVPPVYGGKHIMATSIEEADNAAKSTPWLTRLNLDVHFRAVAGLGRKTVQTHQEEFVNRAWKQVEAVNILNQELHKRLVSVNINEALKNKTFRASRISGGRAVRTGPKKGSAFIAGMMRNLGSMKNADVETSDGETATSLSDILKENNIPQSFASASFQNLTDDVAKLVENLNAASVMDDIAKNQIFAMTPHSINKIPSLEQLRTATNNIYKIVVDVVLGEIRNVLSKYFDFKDYDGLAIYFNLDITSINESDQLIPKIINLDVQSSTGQRPYGYGNTPPRPYKYYGYTPERIKGTESVSYNNDMGSITTVWIECYYDPNVLVIDGSEYEKLFGFDKIITRFGGKNGLYFVSKNGIKQILDIEGGGFFVRTERNIPSIVKHSDPAPWKAGEIVSVNYNRNTDSVIIPDLGDRCRILHPYFIKLYLDKLQNNIQKFDTLMDYVEFLKTNPNLEGKTAYLREWLQLDDCVKHIEAERDARGGGKPVGTPATSMDAAAEELQEAFDDSEAYERMREVAETYYGEFFGNDELIDKYIDELLLSKFPIIAYPIFPEPAYYYLKMFSDKFILPCAAELSDDSVAVFESNNAFTEAYLCGMNTEMGRELLWREYPTDQRGSYFRKFWDSETSADDIKGDNFFDITPVHTWKGNLGENHFASKTGLLLFVIKGRLMRQYPSTQIFLHKAVGNASSETIKFDDGATVSNGKIIMPVIQAFLKEDILLVGFKGNFIELVGDPSKGDYGHFLTFLEDVQDLNFEYPEEAIKEDNAAVVAEELRNDPTLSGKHLSLFII